MLKVTLLKMILKKVLVEVAEAYREGSLKAVNS